MAETCNTYDIKHNVKLYSWKPSFPFGNIDIDRNKNKVVPVLK